MLQLLVRGDFFRTDYCNTTGCEGVLGDVHDGPFKRYCQHIIHGIDEAQLHFILDVVRNIRQVFFVVLGQNDFPYGVTMSSQQFFLEAANRQYGS